MGLSGKNRWIRSVLAPQSHQKRKDFLDPGKFQKLLLGRIKAFGLLAPCYVVLGVLLRQDLFGPEVGTEYVFAVLWTQSANPVDQFLNPLQKENLTERTGNTRLLLLGIPFF